MHYLCQPFDRLTVFDRREWKEQLGCWVWLFQYPSSNAFTLRPWPFDLILIGWRGIVMDYLCARFGYFTFSHFGLIVRTDRQHHTHTERESQSQINAILTRLLLAWVIILTQTWSCLVICLHDIHFCGFFVTLVRLQLSLRPKQSGLGLATCCLDLGRILYTLVLVRLATLI